MGSDKGAKDSLFRIDLFSYRASVDFCAHIQLVAHYNQWMNVLLYEAASRLPEEELKTDRCAFFQSIFGTLNHLAVGDTIWLRRFATHPAAYKSLDVVRALPAPASLDGYLFSDFSRLARYRSMLDTVIVGWAEEIKEGELEHVLQYVNTKGIVSEKLFSELMMHFFNHQTHHRGQATTLLSQAGIDVGMTDLLAIIPNRPPAF